VHRTLTVTIIALLMLSCPLPAKAPPTQSREVVQPGGEPASFAQDVQRRRRRRSRPKRRGGKYEVIEVKNGGRIEGVVLYRGDVPAPRRIQIVKDHETCRHRRKIVHKIRVNDKQQVEDVIVFLGDIKAGKPVEPPAEKPVLNQRTCTFFPHVQVVIRDQSLDIVNSDPVAHNAHVTQHMMTLFNPMQPRQGMRTPFTMDDVGLAQIKCDIHNWMRAYVYVLWHPYYAVTGSDGSFRLTDVPPGEYELVAWQEHLWESTMTVKVEAGKAIKVEFELTGN